MAELVYISCAMMSVTCAIMLMRSYRRDRSSLLLWSCLCFFGLALNNIVLVIDMVVIPEGDMRLLRTLLSAGSGLLLLFGLIWEMA